MKKTSQFISIKTNLSKSVNLDRDKASVDILESYILTSSALQNIVNITNICNSHENSNKAWSLIGPYGSGKSSFALYLSNLLTNPNSLKNNLALNKLKEINPELRHTINNHIKKSLGYCEVLLTGHPESLIVAFLKALKNSVSSYYAKYSINNKKDYLDIDSLLKYKEINTSSIIPIINNIQKTIKQSGGKGLLIIIDELGNFLEYAARHESSDIFLLQLLAEIAYTTDKSRILLFVLLHQAFDQYGVNLSPKLKNEWTKIQGRYETVPFIETTVQSLHVMSQFFEQKLPATKLQIIKNKTKSIINKLKNSDFLPTSLNSTKLTELLAKCYPLHPVTSLLLPKLCQKIAQNERSLFGYLSSNNPFGLTKKMEILEFGKFIMPADIYDYFINGQILTNDLQTQRIYSEVIIALERITDESYIEVNLLKTIGLFNISGNTRASEDVLKLCTSRFEDSINSLMSKSIVTYRKFSSEYRIWQGSDFDLMQSLSKEIAQLTTINIAEEITKMSVFFPFVAKRYSIEKHSLFYFEPIFINVSEYKNTKAQNDKPRVIFCLSDNKQDKITFKDNLINYFSGQDICVFLNNSADIKKISKERIALENIYSKEAVIQQDPVIQREFKTYLINARQQESNLFKQIIENPSECLWHWNGLRSIKKKRELQSLLSKVLEYAFNSAPIIKNELINRDNPSSQAMSGRKKLLLALLQKNNIEDLGITGFPAEKSMYLSVFKDSGMHSSMNNKWQIQPPTDEKFLKVWRIIEVFFNSLQQPKNLSELDAILTSNPYGIKKPVLAFFYISFYLYKKNEIAVYEDRIYVPYFTPEHLERFLKRPETFNFQQFKIGKVTQNLIQEYEESLLGGKKVSAIQDLFKAMAVFFRDVPDYTSQTQNISGTSQDIINAFKYPKNPQDLLFKKLPKICTPNSKNLKSFGKTLKEALQEIKNAYPKMLEQQTNILHNAFDTEEKKQLRMRLSQCCAKLENYTIDEEVTNFIKSANYEYGDLDEYFERIFTNIIGKTSKNWTDNDVIFVSQKLSEYSRIVVNLYQVHQYHTKGELTFEEQESKVNIQKLSEKSQMRVISSLLEDLSKKNKTPLLSTRIKNV